jgi:hypothetical protein
MTLNKEGAISPAGKPVALFFLFIILGAVAFINCTGRTKESDMKKKITITGVCSLEANPCLTKPCLPGMVLALKTENAIYYLQTEGNFLEDGFKWKGNSLKPGKLLEIKGTAGKMTDIFEVPFMIIEINSLSVKNREDKG